jgi:hypothetical protein
MVVEVPAATAAAAVAAIKSPTVAVAADLVAVVAAAVTIALRVPHSVSRSPLTAGKNRSP